MKFGLTHTERYLREAAGIRKFAWLPVELTDGRRVWLETYLMRRRSIDEVAFAIPSIGSWRRWWRFEAIQ